MSFAGNTLDLIRTVINRRNLAPVGPSYFDAVNNNSASYSNVTMGPQNGYNDYLTDSVKLDQDLMSRYADYEDMSDFPELGSALDLYADDATVQDVITNKSMWFEAEDQTVEQVLNEMLDINIRAEESLWEVTRSMCMYGNEFDELMVMDKVGVIRMNHFPAPSMRRIEDMNGILYGFIHDPSMSFRMDTASFMGRLKEKSAGELTPMPSGGMQDLIQVFEPWEMVHFRLRGKSRSDLYGFSSLEAARWAWKRLTMIEDAMVLYKLTRSPQRYAYYVDVGDVPPQQAKGFLNRIKNEFKKTKFIDPNCLTGDTLIPLLDGSHKSIKELANEYAKTKKSFWIYSYDLVRNKVVPGKAVNAVLSGENIPVYRVRLDSGAVIRCTADHPFLMRDGEYKLAADLSKGDSLMPLYLNELRADGYTGFRDVPCGRRFYKTGKQNNHKVVEVAFDGYEDVYDLVVDEYHNFGLTSGVFVHNTGKPNFRYNPMSQDEDIFLPVRKGKRSTEIEVLSGPDGQQIDDAQYFLNKIFAALKIPKSYLGADETVGRANLSQLDSRFSRTVMRIQREVKNGYNQIARVDLAAKNIDPDKVEYECHMVIPSGVFELAQMEVQQAKLDLAQRYKDAKFSEYYVWSEILGMADEDIEKVQGQRVKEQGDAGAFDADGVGTMGEVMPTAIDQARDKMDKKAKDKTDRILTEISQNQTKFAKKINEVKALTQELNHATRNQKYYKGREM